MIVSTHAVATIAVGKLLGIETLRDWFLAFLFGFLIDLDHLKIFRSKHINNGDWKKFFNGELPCHSFLHEPVSIFFIVPLSFYLQTPVPMAAWSVHIFLDYLVDGAKRPFWPISNFTLKKGIFPAGSLWEWVLSLPLSLFLFWKEVI
jgi:hypothetical protein